MAKRGKGGRFVKTATKTASKARRSSGTVAMVVAAPRAVTRTRTVHVQAKRKRGGGRRRSKGGGGGIKPLHVLAGGLALGYLTGSGAPPALSFVKTAIDKVPGSKTFGPAGIVAAGAFAFNHFKPNKYAKLIGLVSLGVAAYQVGTKGTEFKWVGDADDDDSIADVGADDDYDVGDPDDGDGGDGF